ncbi:Zinc ion binding protein [Phytophthora megakarya]|uniref:Zinc ion binding protein n=1 Tax=Phytophthora megakarya TaxID=4795 RepID=A0A225X648_9STRA|nr:Zinc ion binding protein [Phytophthora megakarya]
MSKESEAIDASSVAPAESATPIDTKDDALDIGAPNAAVAVAEENVEPEKSTKDQDSTPTSASHASIDTEIEGKQASDHNTKCSECDLVESSTKGDRLCVCIGCKIGVHRKCLVEMMPLTEDEALQKDEELKDSEWKCDCCRLGVERRVTKCVYCGKIGGDKALKVVETGEDAEFWRQYTGFGENGQTNNAVQFGHVLCVNWDPRRVAAHIVKESKIKPVEKLTKKEMAAKEMAAKEAAKEAVKETVDATRTDRDDTDKSVVDEAVDAVPDVSEVGPGVAVLRMLTHEYTRFVYIKHTRAVEKKRNQKRKRAEHEAQEHLEKERKRVTQEAERAHKKQMLAMRNKQRQHLKATSSK